MRSEPLQNLCCLLLGLLMIHPLWAESPAWSLEQLMRLFAGVEHRQSHFTETRELALLESALESSGTLTFQAPNRLIKSFDSPAGLSYEIVDNRLTLRKAHGQQEVVLLDNSPQLLAYIASLRAVLAGNLAQLDRYFNTHLSGTRDAWLLTLTPRDSQLARQLMRIEMSGSEANIRQFIMIEQGGDRILTTLHEQREK